MRSIFAFIILTVSGTCLADGFTARCKSNEMHEYRHEFGLDRNLVLSKGWNTGQDFGEFTLDFDGQNLVTDQGQAITAYWDGNVLIAVELRATGVSASLWTFAVNLKIPEVVATQVNAYDVGSFGIKSRSISFDCTFSGVDP